MRKTILTSVCAAVIGLSAVAASAQTSTDPKSAAPANQTNVTGQGSTDSSMNAMNKTTKKSKKKATKDDTSGMEKK
jgi:hypothetical protein